MRSCEGSNLKLRTIVRAFGFHLLKPRFTDFRQDGFNQWVPKQTEKIAHYDTKGFPTLPDLMKIQSNGKTLATSPPEFVCRIEAALCKKKYWYYGCIGR